MAIKADFVSAQRVHRRCKQIVWADRSCPQLKICYISVPFDINKCFTSNEVKMTMTTQKICVAIDRKRDIRSSVFLLYLLFLPGTDLSVSVNWLFLLNMKKKKSLFYHRGAYSIWYWEKPFIYSEQIVLFSTTCCNV